MILLGSVERNKLIKIIARQISREKRLQLAAQWQEEMQNIQMLQDNDSKTRRASHIEANDAIDNVILSGTIWQDVGLKNRRPSRIDLAETDNDDAVTELYDVMTSSARTDEDILPDVKNSETITSNSSGYTILHNVKESTKLLHQTSFTTSKAVGETACARTYNFSHNFFFSQTIE